MQFLKRFLRMKTFSLLGKVPAALFLSCALLLTSCHSYRKEVRLDTPHTSPEWTIREAKCDESLNIQPTEDTIIVKLNWWLAKAELRDFSLTHLDSVTNTLCHAGARFEITYWDYQYEYWSFIPAKMRAEYLYDRMNEVCPNSVTAVHVRYEMLKEGEKMPNQPPYKVLMICRRH